MVVTVVNIMSLVAIRNSFGQVNKIANTKKISVEDNSNPNVTTQKNFSFPKQKLGILDTIVDSIQIQNIRCMTNNLIGSFDSAASAAEVQN